MPQPEFGKQLLFGDWRRRIILIADLVHKATSGKPPVKEAEQLRAAGGAPLSLTVDDLPISKVIV